VKPVLSAFAVGVLFALGLGISGMTQPEKVIGFLDFLGNWDPSLAFVMGGAVVVYALGFRMIRGKSRPVFDEKFRLPTRRDITPSLVIGGTLFGMGWGMAGLCPGPALANLATGSSSIFVFVASMIGGMYGYKLYETMRQRSALKPSTT
jgi:uncharacterized protein